MRDENEESLPNFRRQPSRTFRRRVYVASIVSLAVFLVGVATWPLSAEKFRTTASVRVRISPSALGTRVPVSEPNRSMLISDTGSTVAETQTVDAEYFLKALQSSVQQSLSDSALASCIRRAIMQQQPGIAPLQIQQLRDSLDIRVSRTMADPNFRTIQVSRIGNGSVVDQRVVNAIVQEISSRLSRKADYQPVQQRIQKQIDQVASQHRKWAGELTNLVFETRNACERFDEKLDLLALQLNGTKQNHQQVSTTLQKQIEQVRQEVLTSDLQLLRALREQMIGHYDVDETDGMVQHIERLISNRETTLAQFVPGEVGTTSGFSTNQVRSNPFIMASYGKQKNTPASTTAAKVNAGTVDLNDIDLENTGLDQSSEMLASMRLDETYQLLDQLKQSLQSPVVSQLPVISVDFDIQRQPSQFLITDMKSASLGAPVDAVPTSSWLMGLGLAAGLFGAAFALGSRPFQLGKSVQTPTQLASMLGLEHIGTIPTDRQKAGLLERGISGIAGSLFRASEVCVLLALCGVIVAMIWDNQLPGLIAEQPIHGFCRAVWVLFGRGA